MTATIMNNNAAANNNSINKEENMNNTFSQILNEATEEMKSKIHSEEEAQRRLISVSGIMRRFADLMKEATGVDKLAERLSRKMSMASSGASLEIIANDFLDDYERYLRHLTSDQQMRLRILSGQKDDASIPTMVLKMVVDLQKGIEGFFRKKYNQIPKGIVLRTISEVFGLFRAVAATVRYSLVNAACLISAGITKGVTFIWDKVRGVWEWFKGHSPVADNTQEAQEDDIDTDIDMDGYQDDFDAWVAAHEKEAEVLMA